MHSVAVQFKRKTTIPRLLKNDNNSSITKLKCMPFMKQKSFTAKTKTEKKVKKTGLKRKDGLKIKLGVFCNTETSSE